MRFGLAPAFAAAVYGFLGVLGAGAVLMVAAKLQNPSFASGSAVMDVFSGIVILGLACLRVPIHVGDLALAAAPLLGLAAIGWMLVVATSAEARGRLAAEVRSSLRRSLLVSLCFGALCWGSALIFRLRGDETVFAGALGALVWGTLWGFTFARLGEMRAVGGIPTSDLLRARASLSAALVALATLAALGLAAGLVWAIAWLVAADPAIGAGDALAVLIYVVAFAPNLALTVGALGLGAGAGLGAQAAIGGRVLSASRSLSMWDWPGEPDPLYPLLLLLVPLVACTVGSMFLHLPGEGRQAPLTTVLETAALFAIALTLLLWIGRVELQGLGATTGLRVLTPNLFHVFALAFLWMALIGLAQPKVYEFAKAWRRGSLAARSG